MIFNYQLPSIFLIAHLKVLFTAVVESIILFCIKSDWLIKGDFSIIDKTCRSKLDGFREGSICWIVRLAISNI